MLVEVCREHFPELAEGLDDPRVNIYYQDGLRFLRNKMEEYDLIIKDIIDYDQNISDIVGYINVKLDNNILLKEYIYKKKKEVNNNKTLLEKIFNFFS